VGRRGYCDRLFGEKIARDRIVFEVAFMGAVSRRVYSGNGTAATEADDLAAGESIGGRYGLQSEISSIF